MVRGVPYRKIGFTIKVLGDVVASGQLSIVRIRSPRSLHRGHRCGIFCKTFGPQRGTLDNGTNKKSCFRGAIDAKMMIAVDVATIKTQVAGIAEADVLLST